MDKSIKEIKKLFTVFLLIGFFIQAVLFSFYYIIDYKSSKIIIHRTSITSYLSDIRYLITYSYLKNIKDSAYDKNEIENIVSKIDRDINFLIMMEKQNMFYQSQYRDNRVILEDFYKLKSYFNNFKDMTFDYNNQKVDITVYENVHNDFLKYTNNLEEKLNLTFNKVFNEFIDLKNLFYILMIFFVILSIFFIIFTYRREINKILHINEQNKLIVQLSKLATMSQIINIVAHQWKQPLNIISTNIMKLEFINEVSKEQINQISNTINHQLVHLRETIDEFRNFFRNEKTVQSIEINALFESILLLLRDDMINNKIELIIKGDKELNIDVIVNEFKHVFINLINNSKEAFIENNIIDRKIEINIYTSMKNIIIEYTDNAGGIKDEIIREIFKLNYTTKETGTGIGLYLCKCIIERINGSIHVSSMDDGACFKVVLPNMIENR